MLEEMQFKDWEMKHLGLPDGLFSFNDPGLTARKIYILQQLSEIEPKFQKIAETTICDERSAVFAEEIVHPRIKSA